MKRLALLIIWLTTCKLFAQTEDKTLEYYNAGNKAVAEKNYKLADSLFTLSVNLTPHPDTYYNRAVVRKKLNDMRGYCEDLTKAAQMKDAESLKLYWRDCGKTDTIFYDSNNNKSEKENSSFTELISTCKYTGYTSYKKYDSKNNILISYEANDEDTLFYKCETPPKYPENEGNIAENLRYIVPPKKETRKNEKIFVAVYFIVQKNGDFSDIVVFAPNVDQKYRDQIVSAFKKYTLKFAPAQYNGRKVKYKTSISYSVTYR